MKLSGIAIFLVFMVLFTFAVRSVYLWRDFVFVYDQGRDAIAVQKILGGRPTLIGPTTGLQGVFLGPFYYYLLAPLYLVSGGNPIIPAYTFVFLSALTVIPIFLLSKRMVGKWAGVLAVFFYSFSFHQWHFSRWLENPTNLPLVALFMFLCVLKALETKHRLWFVLSGLLLGICLQLEAANAIFLIPSLLVILALEYFLAIVGKKEKLKKTLSKFVSAILADKWLLLFVLAGFLFTLLPQILFELLHNFLSTRALLSSFQSTHSLGVIENLPERAKLLFELYARGWFWRAPWRHLALTIMGSGAIIVSWIIRGKLFKNQTFRVVLIWFLVPLFFHLIYTGNYGNFWDYYIIGQYPALYVLVASIFVLGMSQKGRLKALSLALTAFTLVGVFIPNAAEWFRLPVPYQDRISLSLQLDAIAWLEKEANGQPFGMWAYTPSAQDDVYKYLFSYRARYNGILPVEHPEQTRLMFLIVEDDPGHAERRSKWIKDMSAIGKIVKQERFGIVTVFEVIRKL